MSSSVAIRTPARANRAPPKAIGPHHSTTLAPAQPRGTHDVRDLALWRRKIRDVEFAVRSPDTSRPNPLVVDSLLIASIWSPGAICAVARDTGRPVWRCPLHPFAHDSVHYADGSLFAHNYRTLHSFDAHTGAIRWSWRPPDTAEECLFASPTVHGGRLFIGDRDGRFWCLDAGSGKPLWSAEPSEDQPSMIRSTALAHGRMVAVTTTAGRAVAYEAESGREMWRQQLDGPSGGELFWFKGGLALRSFWSVYLLDPKDGRTLGRWHWTGRYTRQLISTKDSLLAVTHRAYGNMSAEPTSLLMASAVRDPQPLMTAVGLEGERFRRPCPRHLMGLRWSSETGLVYESSAAGVGIIDPRTGQQVHALVSRREPDDVHCGPVEVGDGVIYMLGVHGTLQAVKHPTKPRANRPVR